MTECTHNHPDTQIWVRNEDEDDSGYNGGEWQFKEGRNACEDLDIGRYRCTLCGHVGYYSSRWKEHWEGVSHD